MDDPVFRKLDSLQLPVPDLDAAFAFYTGLGHEPIWRSDVAFGLRLPDSDAELVCFTPQPERDASEVDITVSSVEDAVRRFVNAGGTVVADPFDIAIGRCAVVEDPFGNVLVLLDNSAGRLATDDARHRCRNRAGRRLISARRRDPSGLRRSRPASSPHDSTAPRSKQPGSAPVC